MREEQVARWLSEAELFEGMSGENRRKLARVFEARVLAEGERLFRQGDRGDFLAVLAMGKLLVEVESEKGPTEVSRVEAGRVVGAMACVDPGPRSATVRSVGESVVLVLDEAMLKQMKERGPALYSKVLQGMVPMLAELLKETNAQISGFLEVKRAPTGPRQPTLKAMEKERSRGREVPRGWEMSRMGVMEALTDREWELLLKNTEGRLFDEGEVICLEGENAKAAYLVVDGAVDVLRTLEGTTYRLARFDGGAFLGQQSLLAEGVRTATLRAAQESTVVLGLSKGNFEALLEADSTLGWHFQEVVTRAAIQQLREANQLLGYLGVREGKRQIPNLGGRPLRLKPKKKPVAVDRSLEEISDVEALAAKYLETSLQDWEISASELRGIRVVRHEGEMSAAEKKMRQKFKR